MKAPLEGDIEDKAGLASLGAGDTLEQIWVGGKLEREERLQLEDRRTGLLT